MTEDLQHHLQICGIKKIYKFVIKKLIVILLLKNQTNTSPIKDSSRDIFFGHGGHGWFIFNSQKTLIETI